MIQTVMKSSNVKRDLVLAMGFLPNVCPVALWPSGALAPSALLCALQEQKHQWRLRAWLGGRRCALSWRMSFSFFFFFFCLMLTVSSSACPGCCCRSYSCCVLVLVLAWLLFGCCHGCSCSCSSSSSSCCCCCCCVKIHAHFPHGCGTHFTVHTYFYTLAQGVKGCTRVEGKLHVLTSGLSAVSDC